MKVNGVRHIFCEIGVKLEPKFTFVLFIFCKFIKFLMYTKWTGPPLIVFFLMSKYNLKIVS